MLFLVLTSSRIYQDVEAQATGNVVIVVNVINDNSGTKQASDFGFRVAEGSIGNIRCNPQGGFTQGGQVFGSTTVTVNAPSCFFVGTPTVAPEYSITSSPCDQLQPIKPRQTVTCSYTFNDIPA
jgi:hypothetical protein